MTKLSNEIKNDPLGRDYADMDDEQIFASLTALDREGQPGVIESSELTRWAANGADHSTGYPRILRIAAAAENKDGRTPPAIQGAAMAAYALLANRENGSLDMGSEVDARLAASLVAAGVISEDEHTELLAMATPKISRFAEIGLDSLRLRDVIRARRELGLIE